MEENSTYSVLETKDLRTCRVTQQKGDLFKRLQDGTLQLYALEFDDGSVKIGVTSNVKLRIPHIICTRNSHGIAGKAGRLSISIPHLNAHENEKILLYKSGLKKLYGEYRGATFDDVMSVMLTLNYRTEPTEAEKRQSARAHALYDSLMGKLTGRSVIRFVPGAPIPQYGSYNFEAEEEILLKTIGAPESYYNDEENTRDLGQT